MSLVDVGNLACFRYKKGCIPAFPSRGSATKNPAKRSEKAMSSPATTHPPKGLEGVVATNSKICYIDGDRGVLAYRGIDIHELADQSTFEEDVLSVVVWKASDARRTARVARASGRRAQAGCGHHHLAAQLHPPHALPMDMLRTAVSALSFYDPQEKSNDSKANLDKGDSHHFADSMIVAAYDRIRKGHPVVEPDRSLVACGEFSADAEWPSASADGRTRARYCVDSACRPRTERLDVCRARHGCDFVGYAFRHHFGDRRLKGPLHGGANEAVFLILEAIDSFRRRPG
jgi:citrate synthase